MTLAAAQDLAPYVPRLATELAGEQGASWTSIEGTMLSADISGFTALSEKLAGKGKAGAEEITSLINTCFTALIDSAYDYRGEVIKFGGDALLVLFRGDDHERRCANASLAMQIALHSSPAAKRANLTMTVGASHGPFDVFMVGSGYRELLIIGPAASNVIFLEGEADKGETLISPQIAAHVPDHMLGREHAGGLAVSGAPFDPPMAPDPRPWLSEDLTPFVPPQVVEQLGAFAELGGEHRIVSVGFAMVAGVGEQLDTVGPQATADALGHLIDGLVAAAAPFGVTALHTDIADDGFKVVLCAGAPVNPGDTSDALLQAALGIAAVDSPFVIRQGCQTGRVFAGFLGSPYRRTYTLMGDPVNTAARMLGKAGDRDIVAVGSMVDDTRTIFESEELEPFHVKGKTEPIVAHKIRGATDEVRRGGAATRLFGRERELGILAAAIGELGEIVDIVGPAGVGKSRLLDAAWDEAEGLRFFQGACTPYGATSPYSLWRPLLRNGIGIDVNAEPGEAGRLLTAFVTQAAPDLVPLIPLIAVPFGAEVSSTPQADAIDPEFRRQRIHETIIDLYDTTLGETPVFLVIEDLHWVDDASADLVNFFVRAAADRPWTGVTTRRPEGGWAPEDEVEHVTTIELQPLTDDDIKRIAIEVSSRALSDQEIGVVVDRANGNPLFAIEIAAAMAELGGAALPESIEGVISTRIDGLDPTLRRLLRIAAVLGRTFDLADLDAVAGLGRSDADAIVAGSAGMVAAGDGDRLEFAHAMYRDVAYEGLPYSQRRTLHASVAHHLEATAVGPPPADLLSLHFHAAGVRAKAWSYSVAAGEIAREQYALAEAAAAYERALDAGSRLKSIADHDRVQVADALGDALAALGRYDEADRSWRRARRYNDAVEADVDLMRKLGSIRERQGELSAAVRWYARGRRRAEQARTAAMAGPRARLELSDAGVRFRRGDFERCRAMAKSALELAREAGDTEAEALALDRIHVSTVYLREPDTDGAGDRAVALFGGLGELASKARVLNNQGIEAYFAGNWTSASDYYQASMRDGIAAGNVVEASLAALNSGEILSDQGRWDQALVLLGDALRNWQAAGYLTGMAAANLFIGTTHLRAGDHDAAQESLTLAVGQLDELGLVELIQDARSRMLELTILQRAAGPEEARAFLDDLEDDHPLTQRGLRLLGLAHLVAADHEAAAQVLESAATDDATFENLLVHQLLTKARPPEHPSQGGWADLIASTMDRLDIETLPRLDLD